MKLKHFLFAAGFATLFMTSCSNDDNGGIPMDGTISASVSSTDLTEDAGTVTVTFSTTEEFDTDVQISYSVEGSATSGADYEALPGSVTLTAGETSITQNLVVIDDDEVEEEETIVLTITGVTGVDDISFASTAITLTISDNDSYPYENGVLVLHEGNFGAGNASISFISNDLSIVENGIFSTANDVNNWGDTAQGMAFDGDLAYIILHNSQKIEVVNRYSMESVATIDGGGSSDFLNPRYMAIAGGKGYVSNWGDGFSAEDDFVTVIDLATNTVETTIPVEEGPERILAYNNKVYVAHQGGYSQNNLVSVIDASDNSVETIIVGDVPNSLQVDAGGNLFVLCGGNPSYVENETAGSLVVVDTEDNTVLNTFEFGATEHPGYLSKDGDVLYYYLGGSVYEIAVDATELPVTAEISGLSFYDMAVNNGRLYGVDAKDFVSNGSLEVYDLSDNSLLDSKEVSIIPGEIYFNGTPE
ncbi:MAG: YncE family protein [Algicola sp.]|nr:YncE family protein [Algicola sp.]